MGSEMNNDEAVALLSELSLRLDGRQLEQADEKFMNTRIATRADVNRLFDMVDHYRALAEKAEKELNDIAESWPFLSKRIKRFFKQPAQGEKP